MRIVSPIGIIVLLAGLAAVGLPAPGFAQVDRAVAAGAVSGKVIDQRTGLAIGHATVGLLRGPVHVATTTTDVRRT